MRRREFITLLGGAAAWPLRLEAQQSNRDARVAMLVAIAETDPQAPLRTAAIRDGLRERGWSEIRIDTRFSAGDAQRLRGYAAELLGLKPDVFFAGNTSALAAVFKETRTLPIVFAQVDDPVASGFVASLSRPGGNVTGFSSFEESFPVKWLELLKQVAPRVSRVSLLYDPANPAGTRSLTIMQTGAASLGIEVTGAAVQDSADIENAINSLTERPNGGLAVLGSPSTAQYRELIVERAARHHLPAIYPYRYFVASGGLISYGIDTLDLYRRATSYIDRILRGEKPANLPVQQPTKFEMVVNLRTARTLGIDVPDKLLAIADEVIE
jgi:putative ABC transport system substrate-binding protein